MGCTEAWPVNLDSRMDSESTCIRGAFTRTGKGKTHTGPEQLNRAGRHLQWVRGCWLGETGVGEGYKRVERYRKAPFLSLGSSRPERRGCCCSVRLCHLPHLSGDQHWRARCRHNFFFFFFNAAGSGSRCHSGEQDWRWGREMSRKTGEE